MAAQFAATAHGMASFFNHQRPFPNSVARVILAYVLRNRLPVELVDSIVQFYHGLAVSPRITAISTRPEQHPALKPPADGADRFTKLPTELRRQIFGDSLPDKDVVIRPLCQKHAPKRDPNRKPRRNVVSDWMLLCKTFKDDIKACVYSERIFAIHVHEGMHEGGIEFLDAGRQPLHYKDNISDNRFPRFDHGEFGFDQLKKIEITIFPSGEYERHSAMTTYFSNHALVRMLERSGKEDRIVSITIKFADLIPGPVPERANRRQIARYEHPWWNTDAKAPVSSSIQGISNVELALRPFAMLTTVHNVRVDLPSHVRNHAATKRFVADLVQSMTSNTTMGTLGSSDEFDQHVEAMRGEAEEFIFRSKFGGKATSVPKLSDKDWNEDPMEEDDDDLDEAVIMKGRPSNRKSNNIRGMGDIAPQEPSFETGSGFSAWEDGEDEGDMKKKHKDAFKGQGHTLGGSFQSNTQAYVPPHLRGSATLGGAINNGGTNTQASLAPHLRGNATHEGALVPGSRRITQKIIHKTRADGSKYTRYVTVDEPAERASTPPTPDLAGLDMSDDATESHPKVIKRRAGDSPGSSRRMLRSLHDERELRRSAN